VPRREHGQRAEQADPRPCRAWLALGAVQPGQLVGAGRGEDVPLPADEFGDHAVAELEGGDQLGVAGRQGGGAFLGDDGRRLGPAGQGPR